MGKNRSKRNKIAAKARTNLEGKEKLSSEDLRHQITLSQSRRETQDKSGERSFHSKAPKSSHPKDSQAAAEKFDANSPIVRKLFGWLNKEGEARSQGTGRETGQGEDQEVESQGRISVHKRMRKNASQRLGPRTEESGENSGGHGNEDAGDILKLRKEMEELKRQVDKDGSFGPTVEIISLFTARVMKAQLPRGMKAPEIRYKGVTDPNDHLAAYQTHMLMHAVEDEIQCRLFVGTLEGPAVKWFLTLPNGTIDCFKDLAQLFLNTYGGRFQPKKYFTHLFSLKQKEGETNSELVQRWNEAINEVEPMDDKTSIALFMNVLRSGELFRKLDYDTPTSYKAMMARVNKFCATEESDRLKGKSEGAWHKGPDKEKKGEKTKAATFSIPTLKSLAAPVVEIKSKEEGGQKRKRGDQKRRQWPYDPEKYCNFHRRPGHATEECHFLKKMEGEMKNKEPSANQEPNQGGNVWRRDAQPQQQVQENPEEFPQVGVIFGGPETGVTSKERKEWARKLYVGSIDIGQAAKKGRREPIVFSDEDLPLILSPHRTPLVISMAIHKFFVKRILVDTGSSVNVLYWEAAQQLGIRKEDLTKLNMPLSGFTGDIIEPEGSIKLDIIIGEHPKIAVLEKETVDPIKLRVTWRKSMRRTFVFLLSPHIEEGEILRDYHHEEATEPVIKFVNGAVQKLHIGPGRETHVPPAQLTVVLMWTEEGEEELQTVAKFDQEGMERKAASHPNRVAVDDQSAGDVRIALQSSTRGFLDAIIRRNDSPHLPQLRRSDGGNILILLGFLAAVEDLGNLGDCLLHAIIKVTWAIGTPGSDWRDMRHHDPRSV
ncbi:unnamed protein product [Cuscuta campestris]|uniref:Retrotransposon gag domain-containing protein n=1 Tax=Cuscuta campestris TaxID=132261 RepID=A0A484KXX3_9ASTE|nr:unnamed protein product [Cuscuta campestris]